MNLCPGLLCVCAASAVFLSCLFVKPIISGGATRKLSSKEGGRENFCAPCTRIVSRGRLLRSAQSCGKLEESPLERSLGAPQKMRIERSMGRAERSFQTGISRIVWVSSFWASKSSALVYTHTHGRLPKRCIFHKDLYKVCLHREAAESNSLC